MADHDERPADKASEVHTTRVSRRGFLTGSSVALATTGIATIGGALAHPATAAPPLQATPMAEEAAAAELATESRAAAFFNLHQAATVDAIVSRILPGTADDPGAHEAGVVFYIDNSLSGTNLGYTLKTYTQGPFPVVQEEPVPVEASSTRDIYDYVTLPADQIARYGYQSVLSPQEVYQRGLEYIDAFSQVQFQKNFVDLSTDEQDQILTAMDEGNATEFEGPSGKAFFTKLRNDTIEGMFSDPMYGGNRGMAGWTLIGYPGAQRIYTPADIMNPTFTREPQSLAQLIVKEGH